MVDGQHCGLACMGGHNWTIGIKQENGKRYIYLVKGDELVQQKPFKGNTIYLRMNADATANEYQLLYSTDSKNFTSLGDKFPMQFGHWKGVHIGLYCYNVADNEGQVSFDNFTYFHDGPKIK